MALLNGSQPKKSYIGVTQEDDADMNLGESMSNISPSDKKQKFPTLANEVSNSYLDEPVST